MAKLTIWHGQLQLPNEPVCCFASTQGSSLQGFCKMCRRMQRICFKVVGFDWLFFGSGKSAWSNRNCAELHSFQSSNRRFRLCKSRRKLLQVGHTSRRAIEAIAVKEKIDSQKERRNGERRICMISTWSTEQVPFRRSRRWSHHFVTAAGFGFLIASNPEKKTPGNNSN